MNVISRQLILWYNHNKRELPWRESSDPYRIWLSEVILQQTRIDQGLDYYTRFISEFPRIQLLAKAKTEKVLKLWQGLGYYSRARNLHATAKEIVNKYKGIIPDNYDDLIKLKGIGDYTASAILSIAFNKPFPVIDGNVIRVITRLYGMLEDTRKRAVINDIKLLLKDLLPLKEAGNFNQALMEFGALQCKPQNPDCSVCCLAEHCVALQKKMVHMLPVKKAALEKKERFLNYFLIQSSSGMQQFIYLRKRTGSDIWKNLYDLPCIEKKKKESFEKLRMSKEWKNIFGNVKVVLKGIPSEYVHKLSHQTIHGIFYIISITSELSELPVDCKKVKQEDLAKFPVPRLIEKFLHSKKLL